MVPSKCSLHPFPYVFTVVVVDYFTNKRKLIEGVIYLFSMNIGMIPALFLNALNLLASLNAPYTIGWFHLQSCENTLNSSEGQVI